MLGPNQVIIVLADVLENNSVMKLAGTVMTEQLDMFRTKCVWL